MTPTRDVHRPVRPSWICCVDGEPWPCDRARKELSDVFFGSEEALAAQMAWVMAAAAADLGTADPSRLYRRFVRWTSDDRLPCGRCRQHNHRVVPGLPLRLFPCDLRRPPRDFRQSGGEPGEQGTCP
jgi:hypothetical protein